MNSDERREHLRRARILRDLRDEVLDKFARIGDEEEYAPGQVVFDEGEEGEAMFLVLDGAATVQKVIDAELGAYADLAILEPGAVFGEMALFDAERRSATVRARHRLRVLRISRTDLHRFLDGDPASASAILAGFLSVQNARLREMDEHHATLYKIATVLAAVQDTDELGRDVLERLIAALPAVDAGAFALWNPFDDVCDVVHVRGLAMADAEAVLAVRRDGALAARLKQQQEPFLVAGPDAEGDLRALFRLGPQDMLLVAPLVYGRELVGFILLVSRGAPFGSFHRIMVASAATPVATAVVTARYAQEAAARARLEAARARARDLVEPRRRY